MSKPTEPPESTPNNVTLLPAPVIPDEIIGISDAVDPKLRCHATAQSTGERCGQPAIPGANPDRPVCRYHGGNAPQTRAAALARLTDTRDKAITILKTSLDTYGADLDPRVVLDVVTRLTDKIELLEGRATERRESTNVNLTEIRATVESRLEEIAEQHERRKAIL